MSHSGSSGGHGDGGGGTFHYAVGDNYNPLGSYSDIYKMDYLTEGLKMNHGIRFAILFIAFAGWLYIVYWIRHHDPLKTQAIGVSTVAAPTASQDKSIVSSVRNAFPLKTSQDFGSLYVPSPQPISSDSNNQQPEKPLESQNKTPIKAQPGAALSSPLTYVDQGFDQRFGLPVNVQLPPRSSSVADPIFSNLTTANSKPQNKSDQPNVNPLYASYKVPIQNGNSTSLRTIVNR